MTFRAPCDIVIDEIEDDEKRELVRSMFMYTLNTSPGWRPSDAARMLARLSVDELQRKRDAADKHCQDIRDREQAMAWRKR